MVCTSLGSLLRPLFYFLCYIHISLTVGVLFGGKKWLKSTFFLRLFYFLFLGHNPVYNYTLLMGSLRKGYKYLSSSNIWGKGISVAAGVVFKLSLKDPRAKTWSLCSGVPIYSTGRMGWMAHGNMEIN